MAGNVRIRLKLGDFASGNRNGGLGSKPPDDMWCNKRPIHTFWFDVVIQEINHIADAGVAELRTNLFPCKPKRRLIDTDNLPGLPLISAAESTIVG